MPSEPRKIPELLTRRQRGNLAGAKETASLFTTSLFLWSVFILLLIGIAVTSWLGSFYIFGHPEEPFCYQVLTKLKKIEEPKRFELTEAPRGEFLTANQLIERYGKLTPRELQRVNSELVRSYIRNFNQTKTPLAYVVGNFNILDSFELQPSEFFPSGVVALAQSTENRQMLLEQIFTTEPKTVLALQRMLLTGLDINLQRRLDLSAIIHIEKLKDGRVKFTAIPLLYGNYASTEGPGSFSLEPPITLNPQSGLPVIRAERAEAASQKYAQYRRRAGFNDVEPSVPRASAVNQLVRVERPPEAAPTPTPAAVAVATPVPLVRPAVPVATPEAVAVAAASPTPELQPFLSPTPSPTPTPEAAIANAAGRNWPVFAPGQMPRGRLLNLPDVPDLANRGVAGERLYLQGNFLVTASGNERAVLRSAGRSAKVRIIVDYPAGSTPPSKDSNFSRDSRRPFLITDVKPADEGFVNVFVREVTKP